MYSNLGISASSAIFPIWVISRIQSLHLHTSGIPSYTQALETLKRKDGRKLTAEEQDKLASAELVAAAKVARLLTLFSNKHGYRARQLIASGRADAARGLVAVPEAMGTVRKVSSPTDGYIHSQELL